MTFREFISEDDNLGSISTLMLRKEWNYIEDLLGMQLYKHRSSNVWILGQIKKIPDEPKERFAISFRIDFKNVKNIGFKFGLKKLYLVLLKKKEVTE